MKLTRKSFALTAFTAGFVAFAAAPAAAWDAASPDPVVTPLKTRPNAPFPLSGYFNTPYRVGRDHFFFFNDEHEQAIRLHSNNGAQRYGVRFLHEALGGPEGSTGTKLSNGFLLCLDKPIDGDLDKYRCVPMRSDDERNATVKRPWVMMHKSWIDPDPAHAGKEHDEHGALARNAAAIAGLPASLGKTFWLRYPAPNQRIASQVENGWIVGPSWKPLDMASDSSSTLRPVTLYELAQIPDQAFSVWAWAGGAEECPLDLVAPGFPNTAGDPGNLACVEYMRSIALVNGTHMVPASKSVHHYYHQLALNRMTECSAMAFALDGFDDYGGDWTPVWSSNDTEVHQCEREALVYEMFAQHFLQDAWATGHMWHRWGYTEPSMYSARVGDAYSIEWDKPYSDIPAENEKGRRAWMASFVGSFVGMIHGTKSALEKKAEWFAAHTPLVDDPLNGPWFLNWSSEPQRVQWQDAHGFNASGAGDLFANLVLNDTSDEYKPWRDRFMMCSAASMREVYSAGPKAHGPLGPYLGIRDLDDAELDLETECWSQRATNESMLGSVLPLPLSYNTKVPLPWSNDVEVPVGPAVFAFGNSMVVNELKDMGLPNATDRAEFITALSRRALLDQQRVVFDYLANVTLDSLGDATLGVLGNLEGTESAQARRVASLGGSSVIRYLDVDPNKELPGTPPVGFMDLPDPTIITNDRPQYHYMSRMFWRAHPEDTCEEPGLAARLRDSCISGAEEPGGDPEACTRCVEVAELQLPRCFPGEVSKCTALGYQSLGGIDPSYSSCTFELGLTGLPPYYLAFHYCTGTDPVPFHAGELAGARRLSAEQAVPILCDIYPGFDPYFDSKFHDHVPQYKVRYGLVINENPQQGDQETGPGNDPDSFMPPLITAVTDTRTSVMLDERIFCRLEQSFDEYYLDGTREESSLDPVVQAQIQPLPLWDNPETGLRALQGFDTARPENLLFERCGVTQRASYQNRDCASALATLHRDELGTLTDFGYKAATGAEVREIHDLEENRCSVFEPVTTKMSCAAGTCSANGLCTRHEAAPVVIFHP